MINKITRKTLVFQAAIITGVLIGASSAQAAAVARGRNDWSDIANNIADSIEELPGLISALAYLIGLLMAVLGIVKIKDHVENPTQTPMKDGAVRLAAGGALFGLPIITDSMLTTIGETTRYVEPARLNKVELRLRP